MLRGIGSADRLSSLLAAVDNAGEFAAMDRAVDAAPAAGDDDRLPGVQVREGAAHAPNL